jgi:hypothetical protein
LHPDKIPKTALPIADFELQKSGLNVWENASPQITQIFVKRFV